MDDTPKKHCWKCDAEKEYHEFARKGADSVCKQCRYKLNSEWAKDNRDKLRPKRAEYMKAYRAKKKADAEAEAAARASAPVAIVSDPEKPQS